MFLTFSITNLSERKEEKYLFWKNVRHFWCSLSSQEHQMSENVCLSVRKIVLFRTFLDFWCPKEEKEHLESFWMSERQKMSVWKFFLNLLSGINRTFMSSKFLQFVKNCQNHWKTGAGRYWKSHCFHCWLITHSKTRCLTCNHSHLLSIYTLKL